MSEHVYQCGHCGSTSHVRLAIENCCSNSFEPEDAYWCGCGETLFADEYHADTCCGGQPSQRVLEARGQQRIDGL